MSDLWTSLIAFLGSILRFFHEIAEPATGSYSWGIAIILLTVAVRVVLLPLAVKQINSMRAMQALQPEIKKIQKKYKTDRNEMRTNPEKYRAQRQKQQEEMMALYKEHSVNPASGCLPLLAQAPIFFALFSLLRNRELFPEFDDAGFFLVDQLSAAANTAAARPGALILLALMGVTTFVSQKQTMARNPSVEAQPQQKILLYVMPGMLVVFGWQLPVGVLLYWVTTNAWTMVQQWFMFRNVNPTQEATASNTSAKAGADVQRGRRSRDGRSKGGTEHRAKGRGSASNGASPERGAAGNGRARKGRQAEGASPRGKARGQQEGRR